MGALVLAIALLATMPRTVGFVKRSLDFSDEIAKTRRAPTEI